MYNASFSPAAPLKGIPSRVPTSGFRSPSLANNTLTNRAPISSRIRKDGGIKLLDITEQPMGYAQAKKRKRMLELEEQQKKVAEAQAAATAAASAATTTAETPTTPEYAQGLAPINPPTTPAAATATQSYATPATPSSGVSQVVTPQTREKISLDFPIISIKYLKFIFLLNCKTFFFKQLLLPLHRRLRQRLSRRWSHQRQQPPQQRHLHLESRPLGQRKQSHRYAFKARRNLQTLRQMQLARACHSR